VALFDDLGWLVLARFVEEVRAVAAPGTGESRCGTDGGQEAV
jgi:hypothetical protein